MNTKKQLQLINELAQEQLFPDTIFLHKHPGGWIAYQHCARLLCHYFAPVELQQIAVGSAKLVCAVWQGTVGVRKSADDLVFDCSCNTPERMAIRCPRALTAEQTACITFKSDICPMELAH